MLERQFYSLLGPVLCNTLINDLGTSLSCILSKFAGDPELGGAAASPEGREALQRALDLFEGWANEVEQEHKISCSFPCHIYLSRTQALPLSVSRPLFLKRLSAPCSAWAAVAFTRLGLCSAALGRGSRGAGWVKYKCMASLCLFASSAHL